MLLPLEAWVSPDSQPLDLRLHVTREDARFAEFEIESVADGMRLWVQLALLEACEQAARVATVLYDIAREWWSHAEPANQLLAEGRDDEAEEEQFQADHYGEQIDAVLEELRGLNPESRPWVGEQLAERLERPDPENWTRRLGRHRRFFLIDEPERHLHPNLTREAATWLRDTIEARDTSCIVATHSTPFLALPADESPPLYVYVWREGDDATCEPFDARELKPLDRIATALGFDRGELLTTVSMFLVLEGIHDVVVLERIFGELRAARIALLPMEGLANYQAVLDSDALWRYTTAQVALATDKFDRELLERVVGDPKAAKALRRTEADDETKILAKLIGIAELNGKRIHLLGHRGDDLIDVLDEKIVQAEFARYPGHAAAQKRWEAKRAAGAKAKEKKRFYEDEFGLPMDVETYIQLADAHTAAGIKPPQLQTIVDQAVALARGEVPPGVITAGG